MLLHRIAFSFLGIVEALISRNIFLQKATNDYTAQSTELLIYFWSVNNNKNVLKSTHNISILRIVSWICIFYFPQWFHLAPLFHN